MRYLITIFTICLLLNACNRSTTAQSGKPDGYVGNYVVSFYSIGSGINSEKYLELEQLVLNFNKEHDPPVDFKIITWGREGEKDFCFTPGTNPYFPELSQQIDTLLNHAINVRITPNTTCREGR